MLFLITDKTLPAYHKKVLRIKNMSPNKHLACTTGAEHVSGAAAYSTLFDGKKRPLSYENTYYIGATC